MVYQDGVDYIFCFIFNEYERGCLFNSYMVGRI